MYVYIIDYLNVYYFINFVANLQLDRYNHIRNLSQEYHILKVLCILFVFMNVIFVPWYLCILLCNRAPWTNSVTEWFTLLNIFEIKNEINAKMKTSMNSPHKGQWRGTHHFLHIIDNTAVSMAHFPEISYFRGYFNCWRNTLFYMHIIGNLPESLTFIDKLVQEERNSIALAMELRLSCTNPSICRSYV